MQAKLSQRGDPTPFADGVQQLVDRLAARIARAVIIDDVALRPIAYTPQDVNEIDRVRAVSILRRSVPHEVEAYIRSQDITSARGPIRVRGSARLGMQTRVCAPIRHGDQLLGFVWTIEGKRPLTRSELTEMASTAQELGPFLAARADPRDDIQLRATISDLLSPDLGTSSAAAADVLAAGLVPGTAAVAVAVAEIVMPAEASVDASMTFLISRALRSVHESTTGTRVPLVLARREHGIVIAADEDRARLPARMRRAGEALRMHLHDLVPEGCSVTVGISDPVSSLPGAPQAYQRARRAAIVAARIPQMPAVLQWPDIGVYGLLAPLLESGPHLDELPAALIRLLQDAKSDALLQTLEVYLDNGGDAQTTAADLSIARGSLYYRLNRIAAIARVDLRSGQDRLMLHVGLKLARLAGLHGG